MAVIDFSDDEFGEDDDIRYCPHCEKYGFKVPLQNRIYAEGVSVPADNDQWGQCVDCGTVYAIHEIEKESKIKNAVEPISSPFDFGVEFLGVDSRTSRRKKRQRKQDDYDYINDEDLKRELKKGGKLLSYSEYMRQ